MKETELAVDYFKNLQQDITRQIEGLEASTKFQIDNWKRAPESNISDGGGISQVLKNGNVFEQAGVNFSAVEGILPAQMSQHLTGKSLELPFFATGISLVIHPYSPILPTTHANLRYLDVGEDSWFGGGMDLTPYYLFEEDIKHFHQTLKTACDQHDPDYYLKFKKQCDQYFYLDHRKEARGVGGIFFDYLGKAENNIFEKYFPFIQTLGPALMEAYLPIIKKRQEQNFTNQQKKFQLIRRGRYVEFNLLYDRGTRFGLETGGRTESILMSLPPEVHWEYDFQPAPDSEEEKLIKTLMNPQEWV